MVWGDRDEALADAEFTLTGRKPTGASKTSSGEYSLLQSHNGGKVPGTYGDSLSPFSQPRLGANDDESDSDFFKNILSEIEKVNKFFVG